MSEQEVTLLERAPQYLDGIALDHVMTHLACADQPEHPLNAQQIELFERLRARLPAAPTSIGASAATLMGGAYCGDIVRPGVALYGANPFSDREHSLREGSSRLTARVLQVRELSREAVCRLWRELHAACRGRVLATVSVGYADGYLRVARQPRHGGSCRRACAGRRTRVDGSHHARCLRIASGCGAIVARRSRLVGGAVPIDELARAAGTITLRDSEQPWARGCNACTSRRKPGANVRRFRRVLEPDRSPRGH
jgi:alanine racemase